MLQCTHPVRLNPLPVSSFRWGLVLVAVPTLVLCLPPSEPRPPTAVRLQRPVQGVPRPSLHSRGPSEWSSRFGQIGCVFVCKPPFISQMRERLIKFFSPVSRSLLWRYPRWPPMLWFRARRHLTPNVIPTTVRRPLRNQVAIFSKMQFAAVCFIPSFYLNITRCLFDERKIMWLRRYDAFLLQSCYFFDFFSQFHLYRPSVALYLACFHPTPERPRRSGSRDTTPTHPHGGKAASSRTGAIPPRRQRNATFPGGTSDTSLAGGFFVRARRPGRLSKKLGYPGQGVGGGLPECLFSRTASNVLFIRRIAIFFPVDFANLSHFLINAKSSPKDDGSVTNYFL